MVEDHLHMVIVVCESGHISRGLRTDSRTTCVNAARARRVRHAKYADARARRVRHAKYAEEEVRTRGYYLTSATWNRLFGVI